MCSLQHLYLRLYYSTKEIFKDLNTTINKGMLASITDKSCCKKLLY